MNVNARMNRRSACAIQQPSQHQQSRIKNGLSAAFLLQPRLQRLASDPTLPLAFEQRALVLLLRERRQFILQLQVALETVRGETAFLDRRLHRAARLVSMPAVGEVAGQPELLDIVERLAYRLVHVPQLQLAHARRVDDEAAGWQFHQLAMRRRMTPPGVAFTDLASLPHVFTNKTIDERALADARRPEQCPRPAACEICGHEVDALAVPWADDVDSDVAGHGAYAGDLCRPVCR